MSYPSDRHVTHPCLHIKTAHDAHVLFEAVRLGHLPMIRRRLTGIERSQLRSGDIFVWEEAAHKGGLERWTDGRKWSASRMREPFLFYEEKYAQTSRENGQDGYSSLPSGSPHEFRKDRLPFHEPPYPRANEGLTKQTYSAWVTLPPDHNGAVSKKKWHMTAYFSAATFSSLPSVQEDSLLRQINVPPMMYETGKGLMRKPAKSSRNTNDSDEPRSSKMITDDSQEDDDDDGATVFSSSSSTNTHNHHRYQHAYATSPLPSAYHTEPSRHLPSQHYGSQDPHHRGRHIGPSSSISLPPPPSNFSPSMYAIGSHSNPLTSSPSSSPFASPHLLPHEHREYFSRDPQRRTSDVRSADYDHQAFAHQSPEADDGLHRVYSNTPPPLISPMYSPGSGIPASSRAQARSATDQKALGAFRVML